jgi:tetratricopeptide (TPR) repeat protein
MVDRELMAIYAQERRLFQRMEEEGTTERVKAEGQQVASAYRNFLVRYPDSMEALLLYGKFLRRTGNNKEAMQVFLDARKRNAKLAVVQQELGNCLAEEGEFRAALTCFLNAVELEPEQAIYHYQLALLVTLYKQELAELGEWTVAQLEAQANQGFMRAHELTPDNPDVLMGWGEALISQETPQWKESLQVWDKLAKLAKGDVQVSVVQLYRARSLVELGEMEQARQALQQVTTPALQQNRADLEKRLAKP